MLHKTNALMRTLVFLSQAKKQRRQTTLLAVISTLKIVPINLETTYKEFADIIIEGCRRLDTTTTMTL